MKLKAQCENGVFVYLPEISDFSKKEIDFHNQIHQDEIDAHQLKTVRNKYYHDYFKKRLFNLPANSVILEIGSGNGFDLARLVKNGRKLIASDISFESIKLIKKTIDQNYYQFKNNLIYLVADGQNLPLNDNSVDAVFAVATFHHFENPKAAFSEMRRVTKKGGLIILAMEPSRFMMTFNRFFQNYKNLRLREVYSEADETHRGFSPADFLKFIDHDLPAAPKWILRLSQRGESIIKIKRIWLTLGFLHYGLEAIFRIFKLKKRLAAPRWLEWLLLGLDEVLLKIPLIKQLNWHLIIIIKN